MGLSHPKQRRTSQPSPSPTAGSAHSPPPTAQRDAATPKGLLQSPRQMLKPPTRKTPSLGIRTSYGKVPKLQGGR